KPGESEKARWLAENREAISSINAFLEDHGLLANKLRYRPLLPIKRTGITEVRGNQKYAMLRPQAATAIHSPSDSMAETRARCGIATPGGRLTTERRSPNSKIATLTSAAPMIATLSWNTWLVARWLASAVNRMKPVATIRRNAPIA